MDILRDHTRECPQFLRFIITNLSQKLFTWSNMAGLNLVYPLENRVASYLVSVSELSDQNRLEEIRVNSLEEMADLLCSSYRHLHRILEAFEKDGIIARNRSKIRILDFERLKSLSVGIFE
jgi:CRP-like cAMP-binding protein